MGVIAILLAGYAAVLAVLVALDVLETLAFARAARSGQNVPGARYPATWRPLSFSASLRRTIEASWRSYVVTIAGFIPGGTHALAGAWRWTVAIWVGIVASAALAAALDPGTAGELLILGVLLVGLTVVSRRGDDLAEERVDHGASARDDTRMFRALGPSPSCPRCATREAGEWGLCVPCSEAVNAHTVPRSDERIWGAEDGTALPLADGPPVVWGSLLGDAFLLPPDSYNGMVREAEVSGQRPGKLVGAAWDPADAGACWSFIAVEDQRRLILSGFVDERLSSLMIAWAGRAPDGGGPPAPRAA